MAGAVSRGKGELEGIVLGMSLESGGEDCLLGMLQKISLMSFRKENLLLGSLFAILCQRAGGHQRALVFISFHLSPCPSIRFLSLFQYLSSSFLPFSHSPRISIRPFPFLSLISFIHSSFILSVHLKVLLPTPIPHSSSCAFSQEACVS